MSQFSHNFRILFSDKNWFDAWIKLENCKFYCMQSHNMILALVSTSIFAEFANYRIANVQYFRHKLGRPASWYWISRFLISYQTPIWPFRDERFSEAEMGGGWWLVKLLMLSRFIKLVFMAPSTRRGGERNFTLLIISFLRVISHDQRGQPAVTSLATWFWPRPLIGPLQVQWEVTSCVEIITAGLTADCSMLRAHW